MKGRARVRRHRAARAVSAVLLSAFPLMVARPATAQSCPEAVSSARGEASVSKVDASNGAELPVPAVYSQVLLDTIPHVTYNQSGPYTLGQLEDPTGTNPNSLAPTAWGFLPVTAPLGAPTPFPDGTPYIPAPPTEGRSEAAYPRLQGIPQDSTNSAGTVTSEAHASPTTSSGQASGVGVGGPGGGVQQTSAFTHADVECGKVTMVLGWTAQGVFAPQGTVSSVSQTVTLVVAPDGASAKVKTLVNGQETGPGGRPLDPLLASFNANGTYFDVGDPRVVVEPGRARVEGGGIRYGSADPSRKDTFTFFTMGSMVGEVKYLSTLPPAQTVTPVASKPAASPPQHVETSTGGRTVTVGRPPAASVPAREFLAAASHQLPGVTEDLTTGSQSLLPLLVTMLGIASVSYAGWATADRGRKRFPTGGYAVDWFRARGHRFRRSYLQW